MRKEKKERKAKRKENREKRKTFLREKRKKKEKEEMEKEIFPGFGRSTFESSRTKVGTRSGIYVWTPKS